MDDGSVDDGASLVKAIDGSRILLIRQSNAGVAVARNVGVANTTSPYVTFLDADDTWEPQYLAEQNDLINSYPAMGAYSTGYYLKYPGKPVIQAPIRYMPAKDGQIVDYFKGAASGSNPMWTAGTCIPRSVFDEMGGFPDKVQLHEDLYLWARIALQYPIAHVSVPLATYYKHEEGSLCFNRVLEDRDLLFFSFLEDVLVQKLVPTETQRYVRKYLNQWVIRDAVKAGCAANSRMVKKCVGKYQATSSTDKAWIALLGRYLAMPAGVQKVVRDLGRGLKMHLRRS